MSLTIKSKEIWVAQQPVNFRCGIDGLCVHIQEHFGSSPQGGMYVFYNNARDRLKILVWHHNGFILLYKRLERGRFPYRFSQDISVKQSLVESQLQGLLLGLDWQTITDWEGINFENYF